MGSKFGVRIPVTCTEEFKSEVERWAEQANETVAGFARQAMKERGERIEQENQSEVVGNAE